MNDVRHAVESYDGKYETVRLHLQQQVVYRYVNHTLSEQERFIRGENQEIASERLLSGVHRLANADQLSIFTSIDSMYSSYGVTG